MRILLTIGMLFLATNGCKSDEKQGGATCDEIVETCHEVDPGSGAIHDCHESAEQKWTQSQCVANRTMCLSICKAVDGGAADGATGG